MAPSTKEQFAVVSRFAVEQFKILENEIGEIMDGWDER